KWGHIHCTIPISHTGRWFRNEAQCILLPRSLCLTSGKGVLQLPSGLQRGKEINGLKLLRYFPEKNEVVEKLSSDESENASHVPEKNEVVNHPYGPNGAYFKTCKKKPPVKSKHDTTQPLRKHLRKNEFDNYRGVPTLAEFILIQNTEYVNPNSSYTKTQMQQTEKKYF
ncbi:Hypothetical predicted protein, partial [Mytilus galloprovincialis]